jgi:hypothetical protein
LDRIIARDDHPYQFRAASASPSSFVLASLNDGSTQRSVMMHAVMKVIALCRTAVFRFPHRARSRIRFVGRSTFRLEGLSRQMTAL